MHRTQDLLTEGTREHTEIIWGIPTNSHTLTYQAVFGTDEAGIAKQSEGTLMPSES